MFLSCERLRKLKRITVESAPVLGKGSAARSFYFTNAVLKYR